MAKMYKFGPSVTAQKIGASGISGDVLNKAIIVPTDKTPGAVTLYDGSPSAGVGNFESYILYAGTPTGALSLADLRPIVIDFGNITSKKGAWYITTAAQIQVILIGDVSE